MRGSQTPLSPGDVADLAPEPAAGQRVHIEGAYPDEAGSRARRFVASTITKLP